MNLLKYGCLYYGDMAVLNAIRIDIYMYGAPYMFSLYSLYT